MMQLHTMPASVPTVDLRLVARLAREYGRAIRAEENATRHWDRIQALRAQVAPEVYDALLAKYQPKVPS